MPLILYTEKEFEKEVDKANEAVQKLAALQESLEMEIQLASVWRKHESAQSAISALSQLWSMLGVDNQTAAVHKLKGEIK
ncbi:hypothetical protein DRN75_00880 [Nanoarchaeota archaeon]|nr:MAG: hypothetical protein DRN75_00880 [Nanoarchaeota archaeon]